MAKKTVEIQLKRGTKVEEKTANSLPPSHRAQARTGWVFKGVCRRPSIKWDTPSIIQRVHCSYWGMTILLCSHNFSKLQGNNNQCDWNTPKHLGCHQEPVSPRSRRYTRARTQKQHPLTDCNTGRCLQGSNKVFQICNKVFFRIGRPVVYKPSAHSDTYSSRVHYSRSGAKAQLVKFSGLRTSIRSLKSIKKQQQQK